MLPLAYIAKFALRDGIGDAEAGERGGKASEEVVAGRVWGEVWEDNTGSTEAALRLYLAELSPLFVQGLTAQAYPARVRTACAITEARASILILYPHSHALSRLRRCWG